MNESRWEELRRLALLDNPIRAALYRALQAKDDWVGRDEAADIVEVPRSVAAFHLDKLTEGGLIEAKYARTSGRSGPGAGRPSKLYRRSDRETAVSIPERRYAFVGHLLAEAVEMSEKSGDPVPSVLPKIAARVGREIGVEAKGKRKNVGGSALIDVLTDIGYEPAVAKGDICLRNCPFHELSREHTDLVCGTNLELLKGVVGGLSLSAKLKPRLQPEAGMCCVRIANKAPK
jgi:predicted ArsR family transcriptional regulator